MKISIIIPVYNEANQLDACLTAIGRLSRTPFEVIVVDNNSSDDSTVIAARFPFVKVLHEKRQGVVFARNLGFDAARGDIIGRIDADTLVDPDWTEQIETIFADPGVDAVTGSMDYYNMPFRRFGSRADLFFRTIISWGMGEDVFLQGANMALRRSLWLKTRSALCSSGGMHEDFDLAIHAYDRGGRLAFDKRLHAKIAVRQFSGDFRSFWKYVWLNPKTYAIHGRTSQRHMYSACITVLLFYIPLKIAYRGYDHDIETMVWRNIFLPSAQPRVNPATFVD